MNKRILCCALAALICLSLCSCALFDGITAYSLYSKAVKTIDEAGGFEVDCQMTMTFDIFGEDLQIPMEVNAKTAGEAYQISTDVGDATVYTTFIDDQVYVDYEGSKIRYSVAAGTDVSQKLQAELSSYNIPKLSRELLESIDVIKNEDKTKEITMSLTAEQAAELLGATDEYGDMTFENIVYTMKFTDKNVLDKMILSADCTMDILGVSVNGNIYMEYTFINFGEAPEILLPSAYEEYSDGGEYVME